jgi:methionyl-tRNA synthetase
MDEEVKSTVESYYESIGKKIEEYEFKEASHLVLNLLEYANKYYDDHKPWVLAKENIEEFNKVIYTCANVIANLANILNPFMPESSLKIQSILELDELSWNYVEVNKDLKLKEIEPLFVRITA